MRDPARIDGVLAELKAAWLAHPDWRLGQLIYNASPGGEMFAVVDTVMVQRLRSLWSGDLQGDWNHGHD